MASKTVAVTVLLAALAAAQLSSNCTNGISQLSSNDEASKCLALNQLSTLAVLKSDQSVLTPVDNWLKAFCAAPVCSNSTIETVVQAVSTACATDIQQLGATQDQVTSIIPMISQYFGTAKEMLCLADTKTDIFCASEMAANAQTQLGQPLSLTTFASIYDSVLSGGQSSVNASVICTDCTKGAISILTSNTAITGGEVSNVGSSVCGADFVASATTLPANVVVGTGTAVPKGSPSDKTDTKDGAASTLAVAGTVSAIAGAVLVAFLA